MSRISKKHKIIIIAIISLTVILLLSTVLFWRLNPSEISYGTLPFDKNKEKLYLNDIILWDTGAGSSTMYKECENKIQYKRIPFCYVLVSDFFYKKRFQKLYYSSEYNLADSLNIRNFYFLIPPKQPMEDFKYYNKGEIGFIGMDIIGKANWIIDFDLERIDILPQNKTHETTVSPQLIFEYKHNKEPRTQLDFSVCQLENILIDAGANCEITLLKSDIEIINEKCRLVDTLKGHSYGLHSTEPIIQNVYVYDSITINNIYFNNIQIIEGHRRIIGFGFFKRFDKVFLDTKEKRFCFYQTN